MRKSVFTQTKTAEDTLKKYVELGFFTAEDADIIRKYIAQKIVLSGSLAVNSQLRIIKDVRTMYRVQPKVYIRDLTTDIIYEKIQNVHTSDYKQNTKHSIISINKSFWRYLSENGIGNIDKEKIRSIKAVRPDFETTSPDEILTPDEIISMITHAGSARNRAFVATLYESAGRISEIASLKWKDFIFDEDGVGLWIPDFKNKQKRYVRLISAKPHLLELKNNSARIHKKDLKEEYVFQTNRKKPMTYAICKFLIKIISQDAGINKRVHPHLLRKSRITHLSQDGYSEAIIKEIAWGNQNSNMMPVYSKLSHKDIDNETLRKHGLKAAEDLETEKLHSVRCLRCGTVITPDQKYCPHCGLSKNADLTDAEMSIDPEILAKALKIIMEKKEEL